MIIIFGLGNPGSKYAFTRHNIGFLACDMLAGRLKTDFRDSDRLECAYASFNSGQEKVFIVKPMTYMNNSGRCVRKVIDYYKASITDIIIIADDVYLDFGAIRIRNEGGDGGHNGLKSITDYLGVNFYKRIRCGVGPLPERIPLERFVLDEFSTQQKKETEDFIMRVSDAAECIISDGINTAMNRFNKKNKKNLDK